MRKFTLFLRKKTSPQGPGSEPWQNAASIAAIPDDQLPDQLARGELMRRALLGMEVYAYRPAYNDRWVVWVRTAHPADNMRHYPAEWALWWHQAGEPRP